MCENAEVAKLCCKGPEESVIVSFIRQRNCLRHCILFVVFLTYDIVGRECSYDVNLLSFVYSILIYFIFDTYWHLTSYYSESNYWTINITLQSLELIILK
jgi:hypothetical protein